MSTEPVQSTIPAMTAEEEDQVALTHVLNDERPLKRVIKRFHAYTSVSHESLVKGASSSGSSPSQIQDAREAFLTELDSFHLTLKKSALVCAAEARQVEEYKRERLRIADEYGNLRGQIEQLKTSLEHAQMIRRRKMDYDAIADKVNSLPSREESERLIKSLENDMALIRSEQELQDRTMQNQKSAVDTIVAELQTLKVIGKEDTTVSQAASPRSSPESGEEGVRLDMEVAPPSKQNQASSVEDDIEMGEVEEESPLKVVKGKRREEEMEEGEATDLSSELSDPPEE